jgi:hypothetical protein
MDYQDNHLPLLRNGATDFGTNPEGHAPGRNTPKAPRGAHA